MDIRGAFEAWIDRNQKEGAAALSDADMPHAAAPGESEKTADVTNNILAGACVTFRDETGE